MRFSRLAEYYEKLEATSKRLELVDILSELFKEAKAEEIGKICYLIQGRVAPFFEPIEIGMAEATVASAIARSFNTTKEYVIKSYRKLGNMGLSAKELSQRLQTTDYRLQKQKKTVDRRQLTVDEVFSKL